MNLMVAERWMETAFGAVVEATALASVLIVLVLAVQWIAGKRLRPHWRFALWGIVLVRLLLPTAPESGVSLFNAKSWFAGEKPGPVVRVVKTEAGVMVTPGAVEVPVESGAEWPVEISASAPPIEGIRWWRVLMVVWAAGVMWHLGRLAIGSMWLGRRVSNVESREVDAALEEAARELGTRWRPEVVESALVASPALFGVFRPRLLLPAGFAQRMSERELRHVFLHELAHLKRGDLITNALMAVAQGLHWMNPLVWWAMRQMRVERELACDELVLRTASRDSAERRAYGETILRLMEGVPVRRSFSAAVGIAEEKHSARKRMEQIAEFDGRRSRGRALGIVLIGAIGLCGLTNAQVERQRSDARSQVENQDAGSVGEVQTAVERLRREARVLLGEGNLEEAEQKLIEAQKLAPQHRDVKDELRVLKEQRFSNEASKREASVSDPANNWDSTTPRFTGTESTRTNRIHSGKGREKIVKKLNEIVIDHYEIPNGLKLEEIIKDIHRIARDRDGEKRGVNFIISSDVENPGLTGGGVVNGAGDARGLKVGDYEVTIKPALRDVTLGGLLDAIVEVAVPPNGSEGAPRLRYSVEDYAVVFGQRRNEAAPLYTRTFKLDPNTFQEGLLFDQDRNTFIQSEGEGQLTAVQNAVRKFFQNAGIDFSAKGKAGGPQKAIFFNDRTGVLMARLPLEELEIVEKALQRLNAGRVLQVMISVEAVEVSTPGRLAELAQLMKGGGELRTTLSDRQYREFQALAAKRGFKWSKMAPVTTYSGGGARVQVLGDEGVDVMAEYRESDKKFKVRAVPSDHVRGLEGAKQAQVGDGETLVLMPFADEKGVKPSRVLFIRLDLVDAAGNRVNAGE